MGGRRWQVGGEGRVRAGRAPVTQSDEVWSWALSPVHGPNLVHCGCAPERCNCACKQVTSRQSLRRL